MEKITLKDILTILKKKLKNILFVSMLSFIGVFGCEVLFMENQYTSSVSMYSLIRENDTTNPDLSVSQMLVKDISNLAFTARVQDNTCRSLHLDTLENYKIVVSSETTSRVVTLSVTGPDPNLSASIANKLVENICSVCTDFMTLDPIHILNDAQIPSDPSGPNRLNIAIVGFVVAFMFSSAVYVSSSILNTRINHLNRVE